MVSPEDEQQADWPRPEDLQQVRQLLRDYVLKVRYTHSFQNSLRTSWQDAHLRHKQELRHPNRFESRQDADVALRSLVHVVHQMWQGVLDTQPTPQTLLMHKHNEELVRMQLLQWAMLEEERQREPPSTHEQWVSLSVRHDRSWEGLRRIQHIEWERLTQLRHDVQMVVCLLRHSMSALRLEDLLRRMRQHVQLHRRRVEHQLQMARSLQKKRELRSSSQQRQREELRQLLLKLQCERRQEARHRRVLPRYMHKFGQQLANVQAWLQQQQRLIRRWWQRRGWSEGRGGVRRLGPVPAIGLL